MNTRLRFCAVRAFLLCGLFAALCVSTMAQASQQAPYRIAYKLSMPRPASHLFQVEINIEMPTPDDHVDLQMPRWSPGRYAVFDFAKNVQEVRAQNVCPPPRECESVKLPVTRLDDQTWRVQTGDYQRFSLQVSKLNRNSSLP